MSVERDNKLQVIVIDPETMDFHIETDNDFDGSNGEEYLCEQAEAGHYKSNYDYYREKALHDCSHLVDEDKIDQYMKSFFAYMKNDQYYENIEWQIVKANNLFVVGIMYNTVS